MPLFGKSIETLTPADLLALVENGVSEGRRLDFKLELPGGRDSDKKELLADVTAMANAEGGQILFGVEEVGGVATDVPGLEVGDVDTEMLRLDGVIRTGSAPRVPNVRFAPVPLDNGRVVIVLEVPQSFARPHMVTVAGSSRFFLRHSLGKAPMDIDEIRAAFALSGSVTDRIRAFRRERLDLLEQGDGPFRMVGGSPHIVLHIFPVGMLDPAGQSVTMTMEGALGRLLPLPTNGHNARFNFDGIATWSPAHVDTYAYTQLFRSGAVEAVTAVEVARREPTPSEPPRLYWGYSEGIVLRGSQQYVRLLAELDVSPPFVIGLSVLGSRGYLLQSPRWPWQPPPIDRDRLVVPEVVLETVDLGAGADEFARAFTATLRPAFDAIWNAGGFAGSPYFDADGRWQGPA